MNSADWPQFRKTSLFGKALKRAEVSLKSRRLKHKLQCFPESRPLWLFCHTGSRSTIQSTALTACLKFHLASPTKMNSRIRQCSGFTTLVVARWVVFWLVGVCVFVKLHFLGTEKHPRFTRAAHFPGRKIRTEEILEGLRQPIHPTKVHKSWLIGDKGFSVLACEVRQSVKQQKTLQIF